MHVHVFRSTRCKVDNGVFFLQALPYEISCAVHIRGLRVEDPVIVEESHQLLEMFYSGANDAVAGLRFIHEIPRLFFEPVPFRIREIAIQCELDVLDHGVHTGVQWLYFGTPAGGVQKRLVQLGKVTHFDSDVEFAQPRRAEPELSAL
jgi:hypothetical protein